MQRVVTAVVFREILKPLGGAAGTLGDVVAGTVADALVAPPRPRRQCGPGSG